MSRRIIRTDGTEEPLPGPISNREAARLIGADTLDTVALKHLGHPLQVMLVDDAGYETTTREEPATMFGKPATRFTLEPTRARKPYNAKATALYLANCRPGTTHEIVGDVAIVYDDDFAP